jgi:hypothetical protein
VETCKEAYLEGYLEAQLSDRLRSSLDLRVPKEDKQLEWLLFEVLKELKKLNETLRAR